MLVLSVTAMHRGYSTAHGLKTHTRLMAEMATAGVVVAKRLR
jgi:hypothetical protein